MSPKIVNKEKRREELAFEVYKNILIKGIKEFSIDTFIKEQKIGKSSFYNYFKSKDDAIYYVLSLKTQIYIKKCKKDINLNKSVKENLYTIFDNYLNSNEESSKDLALYKEFFVRSHNSNNENIINLNKYYFKNMGILISEIIQNAINKNELKKEALEYSKSLLMTADGMMFFSLSMEEFNLEKNFKNHINDFINLLGKK